MTKPNPENCKNCSHLCAYHGAQLSYTTQHGAVLIIFPLNLQTSITTQILSIGGEEGQCTGSAPAVMSAVRRRPCRAVAASSSPARDSAASVCWSVLDIGSSAHQPCCTAVRSASAVDCCLLYNNRAPCSNLNEFWQAVDYTDSQQNNTNLVHHTQCCACCDACHHY